MKKNLGEIGAGSIPAGGEPVPGEDSVLDHEHVRLRLSRLFRRCSTDGACGALLRAIEDYRLSGAQ